MMVKQVLDMEHWMVIKAFSRRMTNKETEYKYIKPISLILTFIMRDVNEFLKRDDQLRSEIYISQNKIKQEFSKKLRLYIYANFILDKNYLWEQAYEENGQGSHNRRKDFIFDYIVKPFLPYKDNESKFKMFQNEIKNLLINSGAKEAASAKKIIIKKVEIQKIHGNKNFKWDLSDDINILIGKNGSGKSTILKLINACISKDKETLDKFGYPYIELALLKKYADGTEQKVKITNSKISMDVESVMIDTFDIKTLKCENGDTDLDCKLKNIINDFGNYQRKLSKVFDKETEEINTEISSIMNIISQANSLDLEKFQKLSIEKEAIKNKNYEQINLFKEIVDVFFNDTNKEIILDNDKEPLLIKLKETILNKDNKEEYQELKVSELSSGEKQLLVIFLTVLLLEEKPVILIMDEPETSLHVEWQFILIDKIKELNSNIQILIATHNPLIMLNRQSQEIGMIELDNDVVQMESKGTKYLDVSSVLVNYFGLKSLVGEDMRQKIENLFMLKQKRNNNINLSDEEKSQLSLIENELNSTIASGFIYDRSYLKFLSFVKDNKDIDFTQLKQLNDHDFNSLLDKYKAKFDLHE